MKIEKISDTQVRCTLTGFDLSVRNLKLNELTYGSEKARSLFEEMMQMASDEVGFEVDGAIPIMIEAIPLRDGIILDITKVEDPEEIDARFARFSPSNEDGGVGLPGPEEFLNSLLEGARDMLEDQDDDAPAHILKPGLQQGVRQGSAPARLRDSLKDARVFAFETLDRAIDAAVRLHGSFEGESALYKNPDSGRYYMYVGKGKASPPQYASTCNVLAEFGSSEFIQGYSIKAYLEEHYETLIAKEAIEALGRVG